MVDVAPAADVSTLFSPHPAGAGVCLAKSSYLLHDCLCEEDRPFLECFENQSPYLFQISPRVIAKNHTIPSLPKAPHNASTNGV
jgi:hypothetical protein